ncbi:YeeE/YedE family protein [Oricola cellulosilytica]|uniref:YeeE/YedE family protein n=1 Tax=Oricola cellulosilytica TaxID=1429082 RepID=A0A4R0PAU3_9HYPH|nr:YeeE/YedE family protein [Oricola cellulosilytica]TCD11945.1 YeeE/YedE family protein [Oricola cellulosilytica]
MNFVPLIETIGEPATFAAIGLVLGIVFGGFAERTGFCTRSAALEISRGKAGRMLPLWLIAFATAVTGTQALVFAGVIDLQDTRFFGTAQSISGAIVGGGLFGIGMALARGCASRLVVLGASGNLRAVLSIAIITLVAWATYQGPLVPLRNAAGGLLTTVPLGTNDIAVASGIGANTGLVVGAALVILAIAVVAMRRLPLLFILGGLVIGALIPAGWYLSYQFSLQVFEPVQADSLSFMRPLANTLNYIGSGGDQSQLSMDVGLVGGTLLGAFVASLLFRSFKVRTFAEPGTPHWLRYVAGSALMGFGGILAVGCTIGAGFTGGAALAITGIIALAAMIGGAIATDRLVDYRPSKVVAPSHGAAAPAE